MKTEIRYYVHVHAEIVFDGCLHYTEMTDSNHPLQDFIDKAEWFMAEYNFTHAEIIDFDDGTSIAEIVREEDDDYDYCCDDEPAYYDDGDTCGYE